MLHHIGIEYDSALIIVFDVEYDSSLFIVFVSNLISVPVCLILYFFLSPFEFVAPEELF